MGHGEFGWLDDKFIMSLAMDRHVCFSTGRCSSLEHKLSNIALQTCTGSYQYIDILWYLNFILVKIYVLLNNNFKYEIVHQKKPK